METMYFRRSARGGVILVDGPILGSEVLGMRNLLEDWGGEEFIVDLIL
jgi:hypothetical protein